MSKKNQLTDKLAEESELSAIDQALSKTILELEERGFRAPNIAFMCIKNLTEYSFCRSSNATVILTTLLSGLLHELERRCPVRGEEEDSFEELDEDGLIH